MLILWEEEEDKPEYYQYGINTTKKNFSRKFSFIMQEQLAFSAFGSKYPQICDFMGVEGYFLIYYTMNCETTILARC